MIKFRILKIFIAFILSLGFTAPLDAELISFDDPVFGDNSITLDTDTGLEWLDLTKSTNRSFNDVSNELGVGGNFAGFRYATIDEINTFWANAGIPNIESFTEANLEPVASLMSLIGCTNTCSSDIVVSSIGLSGSFASISSIYMPAINQLLANTPPVGGAILISNISPITSPGYPHIGSWLVRSTTVIYVSIDIKPGSNINPINPKSKGVLPVVVQGSMDFDATQIDSATVTFGPDGASPTHDGHVEDVNRDGFIDMVYHFIVSESGIVCGITDATLRGETYGGEVLLGTDMLKTVGCK